MATRYMIFKGGKAWTGNGWTEDKYSAVFYLYKRDAEKANKTAQGEVSAVDTAQLFAR